MPSRAIRSKHTPKQNSTFKKSFQVTPVLAIDVSIAILKDLTTTYAHYCNFTAAVDYLRSGEVYLAYLEISERTKEATVETPVQFWVFAQASAAVKKLVDPSYDRLPATYQTWWSNEERCRKLNRKFDILMRLHKAGTFVSGTDIHRAKRYETVSLLQRFRAAIHYVLGDCPPLDDIAENAYYGPGSSTGVKGREVHYHRKVQNFDTCSGSVDLASLMLCHDKAVWSEVGMDPTYSHLPEAREGMRRVVSERLAENVVPADHLMFVHKNIAVQRSICAQPTVSGALQLGFHVDMAHRLLTRCSIDLSNQGWNQKLARLGSLHWRENNPLCTLDKSDASALISQNLVLLGLPAAWCRALMRTRTASYFTPLSMGGKVHPYYMYGGMGNGTTFAIQTLLFWAGAYATSGHETPEAFVEEHEYAVYGDDVILRRDHAKRYMSFMHLLGLRFNKRKTFLNGPFRESCGADYYDGQRVRPATVDSESGTLSELELIGIHNTLADGPFPLKEALASIRRLWRKNVYPQLPTDNQGNLGFRPIDTPHYSLVRDSEDKVIYSSWWHRPRTYMMEVRSKQASLGTLDSWTQMAVALLAARHSGDVSQEGWSLPVRKLTNVKVVPERDMLRKDTLQMLANSLQHLARRKDTSWFKASRGLV